MRPPQAPTPDPESDPLKKFSFNKHTWPRPAEEAGSLGLILKREPRPTSAQAPTMMSSRFALGMSTKDDQLWLLMIPLSLSKIAFNAIWLRGRTYSAAPRLIASFGIP